MTPLPCPFCGHTEVNVFPGSTFRWVVASCLKCDAIGPEARVRTTPPLSTEDEKRDLAIAEWNRRAAP